MVAHTQGIFEVTFAVRQVSKREVFSDPYSMHYEHFLDTFHGVL